MSASHFAFSIPKRTVYAGLLGGGGITLFAWADPFHLRCGKHVSGRFIANVRRCYRPNLLAPPQCVDVHDTHKVIGTVCNGCGKVMHAESEPFQKDAHYAERIDGKVVWMTHKQAHGLWHF